MEIWIIREGEKIGPLHDFEVRRKIEDGELPASTPAWHEGLDEWRPLVAIDLFAREFELAADPRMPAPPVGGNPATPDELSPPPLPRKKTFYIRRFWARWFDLNLYASLWWLGMWAAGQNIGAVLQDPWIMFLQYVPWFAAEALLLHYLGTTPGKWLLGLRVINQDDSGLSLAASMRRSLKVMVTGVGFGWGLLSVFCQTLSLITAKRLGTPLWDYTGGHRVDARRLNPFGITAFVFLLFAAAQLQMLVLPPVVTPQMLEKMDQMLPGFKKEYQTNPPWHLPDRSKNRESP